MTEEKVIYRGRIVDLVLESTTLPNGRAMELEVVRHPGGAAVVALDDQERVCLLRQYRHAHRGWIWELPAGKLDPGEAPLATAQRELVEEAGRQASRWIDLGRIITSPGVFTEVIHLYLAEGLEEAASAPEEHELFEVHWLPLADAVERALTGGIEDSKTIVGLARAARRLAGGE